MKTKRVAEGAYFVPSYSEQTVIGFRHGISMQSIVVTIAEAEDETPQEEEPVFTKEDLRLAANSGRGP